MGSAVSSDKSCGVFWVLQVSSPAVLLLDLGVIHSSVCGSARKFSGWLDGSSRNIWLLWFERAVKQYTNELRIRTINE